MEFASFQEAQTAFNAVRPLLASHGVVPHADAFSFLPESFASDINLAMDAQPPLLTTPNDGGVLAAMSLWVDPKAYEVILSPTVAAEILGEVKAGVDWTTMTAAFPTWERIGQAAAYGDLNEGGMSSVNIAFPQRQAFRFQTMINIGDLELDMAALAKLNLITIKERSAANTLQRFLNFIYHFGVSGLQNFGILNDPGIASNGTLTPATKANGGTAWVNQTTSSVIATANETYADIQAVVQRLITQSLGNIDAKSDLVLVVPTQSAIALNSVTTFNVNVEDMIKKNFPKMRVISDPMFGAVSTQNPQGNSAGNLLMCIAPMVESQESGYCAFSEKMRAHPIVRQVSSYKQKRTAAAWGAVIRQPFAFSQMLGI
jgi:hypothetical protein